MTTRTFPIFRSLQRAIDGSVVVAHKPAIAVTARQFYQSKEEETKDDETEKGSDDDEPRLTEGHLLNDVDWDNDGIQNSYPGKKWPINSEKARQLRREFVQEGYRRLYNIASAQSLTVTGGTIIDAIGNDVDRNEERSSCQHEGAGLSGALGRIVGLEPVDLAEDHETPREIIPINGDEDWVYYAQ